jgi:signal transduction histidine kinase
VQAESIEHITGRMEHLIGSMLDAATIEAGRFTISKATFSVDQIVHEALEMFENLAASKRIHLERVAGEAGLVIDADRERALQVISNLVGNALKFTPQGGHVTVSAEHHGDLVLFSVSDTGCGIASQDIPRVFDRYWKQETRGQKGTGLGLFIAKGIVDAHGGRIWVESEPGHGATFRFSLPAAESARAAAACGQPGAPADADLWHGATRQR